MKIIVELTRRQAEAILRAELSNGHGVVKSTTLVEAERRLKEAIRQHEDFTT